MSLTPAQSPYSSPKRKRYEPSTPMKLPQSSLNTSFHSNIITPTEDTAESPRTQVSTRFEKLLIDEDGKQMNDSVVRKVFKQMNDKNTMEKTRKRFKLADGDTEIPETPQGNIARSTSIAYVLATPGIKRVVDEVAVMETSDDNTPELAHPLNEHKPKKQKAGKLHVVKHSEALSVPDIHGTPLETDRADLTWHDHEITGFDPNDQDDDGRGLDGIGFKPTAARNDARALKKRQQLAEYRSRISSEARAKRSEKRRGACMVSNNMEAGGNVKDTRVKFAASEVETIFI